MASQSIMIRTLTTLIITCFCLGASLAQDTAPLSAKGKSGGAEKQPSRDTGKEKVGQLKATLYIGTDNDATGLGKKAMPVTEATAKRLRSVEQMRFKTYRQLGHDTQPVFRSYENWLSPLKPSEEILLSFESRGRSSDGGLRLDLGLWQHRRKVMTSAPVFHKGKPLLILGPKWRGGTLIIAVELISLESQ